MQKTTREEGERRQRVVLGFKDNFWAQAAAWSAIVFSLVAGVAALGWFYWTGESGGRTPFFLHKGGEIASRPAAPSPAPAPAASGRRIIDGAPTDVAEADQRVFAVMIDNMIDARPPSGLARASLVIEAPVEGGITRFEAFFASDSQVSKIGPVRSARPYYLDWAAEFNAVYAHVGGSPEALDLIASRKPLDLNEFFAGKYFWRDSGRKAPHSTYTSTSLLAKALTDRFAGAGPRPQTAAWKYRDGTVQVQPGEVTAVTVDYSTPAYRVVWRYDAAKNAYRRFQNEDELRDDDGAPIRASNVVVQYNKVRVLDEIGRRRIETVGQGQAVVFFDGSAVEATWKKTSLKDRTRYYAEDGSEIAFEPGTTWVEVVPTDGKVTY